MFDKSIYTQYKDKGWAWTHSLFNYIKATYVSLYLVLSKIYTQTLLPINKYNINMITCSISPLPRGLHHQRNNIGICNKKICIVNNNKVDDEKKVSCSHK